MGDKSHGGKTWHTETQNVKNGKAKSTGTHPSFRRPILRKKPGGS